MDSNAKKNKENLKKRGKLLFSPLCVMNFSFCFAAFYEV